ncbi:MAG: hypothetical protein V3V31_16215 [Methylococcales bacterium]
MNYGGMPGGPPGGGGNPPKDPKETACTWIAIISMICTTPWIFSHLEPELLPFLEMQYGEKYAGWVNNLLLCLSFPALYGIYKAFTMIAGTILLAWIGENYWASRIAAAAH